jgi:hypothetical protein
LVEQRFFLPVLQPVFIPIVDGKCNQYSDDNKYDLPNGIPHVLKWLIGVCELFADFSKEVDHGSMVG